MHVGACCKSEDIALSAFEHPGIVWSAVPNLRITIYVSACGPLTDTRSCRPRATTRTTIASSVAAGRRIFSTTRRQIMSSMGSCKAITRGRRSTLNVAIPIEIMFRAIAIVHWKRSTDDIRLKGCCIACKIWRQIVGIGCVLTFVDSNDCRETISRTIAPINGLWPFTSTTKTCENESATCCIAGIVHPSSATGQAFFIGAVSSLLNCPLTLESYSTSSV